MATSTSALRVLLIEENTSDVRLMRDALASGELQLVLKVICDGLSAVDWLISCDDSAWQKRRPDLILLSLELPSLNARNILTILKAHERTHLIPVIVLASSGDEHDVNDAYEYRANCYVEKSSSVPAMFQILRGVQSFWMATARLSPK